jgi:ribosomal protein S18 acetylase RimI-like enzyme
MSKVDGIPGYSQEEIIHQIELNLWETWSNFGRGPGCTLHDEGDVLWFETPIPFHPYNTVLKFQVEDHIDRRLDQILGRFSARRVPVLWLLPPSSQPADLADRLSARGLQEIEVAPCMARSLEGLPDAPPLPAGVEIREAVEDTDLGELSEFAAWRWGVPDEYRLQLRDMLKKFEIGKPDSKTRMWLAWKEGVAISKIGLYQGSGSAGIYGVATKPEARGLGIASILMNVAMRAAKETGYDLVVLDSSPLAEKLYQRLGFVTLAPLRLFSEEAAYL